MKAFLKNSWTVISWFFRGRLMKKVTGGWCGCCGAWVETAEFTFRDYWIVDNFWDLNTICQNCSAKNNKGDLNECCS